MRAGALRGLRSPAPSPAALNKNLIKCRGRPPPGLGRPDHRAGFLLQTALAGPGPAVCVRVGALQRPVSSLPCGLSGCLVPPSPPTPPDHLIPVFVSPSFLLPLAPFFLSLSLLLHFLFFFFSQPGSVSVLLLSSCLKQPRFFFMIWFPISVRSLALLPSGTILLSQRGALFAAVSHPLSLSFPLSLFLGLSSACSPLGLPYPEPLSHSMSPLLGLSGLL